MMTLPCGCHFDDWAQFYQTPGCQIQHFKVPETEQCRHPEMVSSHRAKDEAVQRAAACEGETHLPAAACVSGVFLNVHEYNRLRSIEQAFPDGPLMAADYVYGHPDRCTKRDSVPGPPMPGFEWACHKKAGHDGACSTHMDCGETSEDHVVCGLPPKHEGPHSWQVAAERRPVEQETPWLLCPHCLHRWAADGVGVEGWESCPRCHGSFSFAKPRVVAAPPRQGAQETDPA